MPTVGIQAHVSCYSDSYRERKWVATLVSDFTYLLNFFDVSQICHDKEYS